MKFKKFTVGKIGKLPKPKLLAPKLINPVATDKPIKQMKDLERGFK